MSERTAEDRLREEYFTLLPTIRKIREELEAEVRHRILPLSSNLNKYEKIEVASRIKDCESALGALRRRQEGGILDPDQAESYTLTSLNDLAGVRVLVFPGNRWKELNYRLRSQEPFNSWNEDSIFADEERKELLAFKYFGHCSRNIQLRAELQIVPMLVGLFWQVEHSAIYKPSPELKGVQLSLEMRQPMSDVYRALRDFESKFEQLVRRNPSTR